VREKRINVVTLYDSPTCVTMLNYQTSKLNELIARNRTDFLFLYKMVPVDAALTETNYAIYLNKLSQLIKSNLNQSQSVSCLRIFPFIVRSLFTFDFKISNVLNELEDFHFLLNYNGLSDLNLTEFNTTIQLSCTLNVPITNTTRLNETVKYCYRRFQFFLFGFNVTTLKYQQIATIRFTDLNNQTYNFQNTSIFMPNNYTFAMNSQQSQTEPS
jgi:hypothetical protein